MLSISNISVNINSIKILNDLSLEVSKGETVGIIGPNGSGKTTLFNTISGFIPALKGEIKLAGQTISSLSPYERARLGLGRVFQHFGVFHEMTVLENILVACEAKNLKISQNEIKEALETVGLSDRLMDRAASLSGGQKRLLEMCRTVTAGSEVFLLDEPTAGVSPKMKTELIAFIRKLQQQGKTILVIEHDMHFISEFSSRIVVLNQGQVVLDGSPQEVRENQMLKEIYFGR